MSTTTDRIAIFPAAGSLGSSIYNHLSKIIKPERMVLISRNPGKVPRQLVDAGVKTRQADYDSPETLVNAFVNVAYLCLISYPSIEIEHRFEAHKTAISAALRSNPGLKHIFYTSLAFPGLDSTTSAAHGVQAHLQTEAWLQELVKEHSGLRYTAIREGIYAETFPITLAFQT